MILHIWQILLILIIYKRIIICSKIGVNTKSMFQISSDLHGSTGEVPNVAEVEVAVRAGQGAQVWVQDVLKKKNLFVIKKKVPTAIKLEGLGLDLNGTAIKKTIYFAAS